MLEALGLVETVGSADAVLVVDLMVKTSDVEFQTWHTKCGGHTTVFVSGGVSAVTAAVDRVKENPPCEIVRTAVISNPAQETEKLVIENRQNSRFAR